MDIPEPAPDVVCQQIITTQPQSLLWRNRSKPARGGGGVLSTSPPSQPSPLLKSLRREEGAAGEQAGEVRACLCSSPSPVCSSSSHFSTHRSPPHPCWQQPRQQWQRLQSQTDWERTKTSRELGELLLIGGIPTPGGKAGSRKWFPSPPHPLVFICGHCGGCSSSGVGKSKIFSLFASSPGAQKGPAGSPERTFNPCDSS